MQCLPACGAQLDSMRSVLLLDPENIRNTDAIRQLAFRIIAVKGCL